MTSGPSAPASTGRAARRPSRVSALTALAAMLVAFVVVAFSLPIDDFWLSVASGRAIMHGASITQAVPLTWLPTLPNALNPQWGSQVALAAVDNLGWALAVNAALLALGLGITLERMRGRGSATAVAVAALVGLAVLAVHLLARAQSFSIALFPLSLLVLERLRGRWWLPPLFGLLVALWANLHGAFVVGQLAAACWFAGAAWSWAQERGSLERRRDALIYGAALALSLVGPILNPAGTQLLAYAYGQGTSELIRAISVEWQPSWPWEPVGLLFWLLAAAVVVGRLVRRGGAPMSDILLLITTGALAASAIRHIPWFVLSAAPVLAGDIDRLLERSSRLRRGLGEVPALLRTGAALRVLLIGAVVAVALQPLRPLLPAAIARLTPDAPVALADALRAKVEPGEPARVLNEQVWGGYLAWDLKGSVEPAMDGRIEIRSEQTWRDYFSLMAGQDSTVDRLRAAQVTWAALFTTRTSLVAELSAAGWHEVARAGDGVLLQAP